MCISGAPVGGGFSVDSLILKNVVVQMLEASDIVQADPGSASGKVCDERCLQRMRELAELIGCSQGPAIVSSSNDPIVYKVGYLNEGTLLPT